METIKKYWKRFVEWVTVSEHSVFSRTRLKLVFLGILAILLFLFTFHLIFGYYRDQHIIENVRHFVPEKSVMEQDLFIAQAIGDQESLETKMQVVTFVILSLLAYFASGIILRPIKKTLESQRRFIADAAHELRTPLSIIKTSSEVALLEERPSVSDLARSLKENVKEIDRMAGIIKNLMNISRANEGDSKVTFSRVNLSQLVTNMIQSIKPLARKRKIKIDFYGSENALVWGNPVSLEEMILNLLKNAVIYTPRGGTVNARVLDKSPRSVELTIKDSGIGISKQDISHIFEPFYKAEGTRRSSKNGSSGLGLAIVREIIRQHRASIRVKSTLNKGTSFLVDFVPAS